MAENFARAVDVRKRGSSAGFAGAILGGGSDEPAVRPVRSVGRGTKSPSESRSPPPGLEAAPRPDLVAVLLVVVGAVAIHDLPRGLPFDEPLLRHLRRGV